MACLGEALGKVGMLLLAGYGLYVAWRECASHRYARLLTNGQLCT